MKRTIHQKLLNAKKWLRKHLKSRTQRMTAAGIALAAVAAIVLLCVFVPRAAHVKTRPEDEMRGVWFSFINWEEMPKEEKAFKKAAAKAMDAIADAGLNTVFLHVHSHSDSYYLKSSYFPVSKFISGQMGTAPAYDPLEIMINEAHKRGLALHAWVNPFRVAYLNETYLHVTWSEIPADSIVKKWWNSPEVATSRNVLLHDGAFYLNPSKEDVKACLVDALRELVREYDIDGLHFDDYFYPWLNDSEELTSFDKREWEESGSALSLPDWRRANISDLVSRVYAMVHEEKPNIVFGISPIGNLRSLRSDSGYFADVDTWLSKKGYIDYILPQIYWGFETRSGGELAPWSFENCLNDWCKLAARGRSELYIGLALYNAGSDVGDGNEVSEWLTHDDIIARQIEACRGQREVGGFSLYSYSSLFEESAAAEIANMRPLLGD